MNHNSYEYIIIGGGLSGCILGFLLKKANKNVLILEKQNLNNKYKLCGGILSTSAYNSLLSIFDKNDIDNLIHKTFKDVHFNDTGVSLGSFYSIVRKELDDFVLTQYLSVGGEIVDSCHIASIDTSMKLIYADNNIYKYNILIGADGASSFSRRELKCPANKLRVATQITIENPYSYSNLHIIGQSGYVGYSWVIPTNNQIILGTFHSTLSHLFNKYQLSNNYEKYEKQSAVIPTGSTICLEKQGTYFIGDAAGLADPVSGEGIYYAVESAKRLSISLLNNINYFDLMEDIIGHLNSQRQINQLYTLFMTGKV